MENLDLRFVISRPFCGWSGIAGLDFVQEVLGPKIMKAE
jgi:hypothetical protein